MRTRPRRMRLHRQRRRRRPPGTSSNQTATIELLSDSCDLDRALDAQPAPLLFRQRRLPLRERVHGGDEPSLGVQVMLLVEQDLRDGVRHDRVELLDHGLPTAHETPRRGQLQDGDPLVAGDVDVLSDIAALPKDLGWQS